MRYFYFLIVVVAVIALSFAFGQLCRLVIPDEGIALLVNMVGSASIGWFVARLMFTKHGDSE